MDAVLRPEGDVWTVEFNGTVARLRDARGLRYLAELLVRPGQELHALDLVAAVGGVDPAAREPRLAAADTGPMLDDRARAAYKTRLADLAEELEEAEQFRDTERATKAQLEIDALVDQLAAATGIGGRARRTGSDGERARVAVRRALKLALDRIRDAHPELGRHLDATLRTGTFCSYVPDPRAPVTWRRDADPGPAPAAPAPTLRPDGPLVGRERERAALLEAWSSATSGRRTFVVVSGEPGIGKTALAADVAGRGHADGAFVVTGRCDEGLGVPFQPFVPALRALVAAMPPTALADLGPAGRELGRLLPELTARVPGLAEPTRADPDTERYLLFDAVSALVAAAAALAPTVLVLDDLQWATEPTLFLLRHLLRAPGSCRLLVVATCRDTEVGADHPVTRLLADVGRDEPVVRVPVEGLRPEDVADLFDAAGIVAGPSLAEDVCERTRGNPLFVREIVRHLAATGDASALPDGLREAISSRVGALSGGASQLLLVTATVGHSVSLRLAGSVLRQPPADLVDAVDELVAARLLVEEGDGIAFGHGLVRQAVYESLSAARRAALHAAVAEALEAGLGSAVADLAFHFAEAAPVAGPDRAAHYGRMAAEQALAAYAYEDAITHADRALRAVGSAEGAVRLPLLLLSGRAAMASGRGDRAGAVLDEAAALARACGDRTALAEVALELAGRGGDVLTFDPAVITRLEEAEVGLDADDPLLASVLARHAVEHCGGGELDVADAVSARALDVAHASGDPHAIATALRARHIVLASPHHLDARLAIGVEMVEQADAADDQDQRFGALASRLRDELERGDVGAVDALLAELVELAARLRRPRYQWYARQFEAMRAILAGDLDEGERLAEAALALGTEAGSDNALQAYGVQLVQIRREQGRLDELLDTIAGVAGADPAPQWSVGLALAHAEAGRTSEALDALARLGDLESLPRDAMWMTLVSVACEVGLLVGETSVVKTCADLLSPLAGRNVVVAQGTLALGSVDRLLGEAAALQGDVASARASFDAALALDERLGARHAVARDRAAIERMAVAPG